MIVYKIDKPINISASQQIKDMAAVLDEMAPSLEVLQKLLNEHRQSLSTPKIDKYRANLQRAIEGTIQLNRTIAQNARQLITVSDQASKHLASIDEHFGDALGDNESVTSPLPTPAKAAAPTKIAATATRA